MTRDEKIVDSGTAKSGAPMTAAVYVGEDGSVSYFHHRCAEILGFDGIETPVRVSDIPDPQMTCPRFGCGKSLLVETN